MYTCCLLLVDGQINMVLDGCSRQFQQATILISIYCSADSWELLSLLAVVCVSLVLCLFELLPSCCADHHQITTANLFVFSEINSDPCQCHFCCTRSRSREISLFSGLHCLHCGHDRHHCSCSRRSVICDCLHLESTLV